MMFDGLTKLVTPVSVKETGLKALFERYGTPLILGAMHFMASGAIRIDTDRLNREGAGICCI